VHEWRRSVAATNTYWKNTLTNDEVQFVQGLNGWIFAALEEAGPGVQQVDQVSTVLPVAVEARL
jgi:hypothetical protein